MNSTDLRRFPAWAWLVLIGAAIAVLTVVLAGGGDDEQEGLGPVAPVEEQQIEGPEEAVTELPEERALPSGLWSVELRTLGGVDEGRIAPKRGSALEGMVLNEQLEGIEGVRLTIVGGPQDGWSTVSRKEGHYLFPEMLPGTHFFRIEVPGYGTTVREHRVRSDGRSRRDFRVSPPVGVDLIVRDHENKPLEGARVIYGLDGAEVLTNADGLAQVPPFVGGERVLLTIRAEGHVPVRQELNLVLRPSDALPIEVPPLPKGAILYGKVSSWPGGPFPEVSIVPRSNQIGTHKVAWETWQGVRVENDGSFTLEGLPTSHLIDLRVFHPGGVTEPAMRSVRPMLHTATRVKPFVIKRGQGRVAGRVVDRQGQGVASATVVLEAADPEMMLARLYPGLENVPSTTMLPVPSAMRRELTTGKDGRFDFAVGDHPSGTGSLVLTARAEGYASERLPIRRSYSNLEVRLSEEDHSSSLWLKAPEGEDFAVDWYLDGEPIDEIRGVSPRFEATRVGVTGLPAGLYDVVIRSGDQLLRHERELRVEKETQLSW